ncbi:hypothetical protein [Planomonospora algeriensis]
MAGRPPAMAVLVEEVRAAGPGMTVVMCGETLWWRCHRRLISGVAATRDLHSTMSGRSLLR